MFQARGARGPRPLPLWIAQRYVDNSLALAHLSLRAGTCRSGRTCRWKWARQVALVASISHDKWGGGDGRSVRRPGLRRTGARRDTSAHAAHRASLVVGNRHDKCDLSRQLATTSGTARAPRRRQVGRRERQPAASRDGASPQTAASRHGGTVAASQLRQRAAVSEGGGERRPARAAASECGGRRGRVSGGGLAEAG